MKEESIRPNTNLDQLAVRMFKMFSRFEYALKASTFRRQGRSVAEPDWNRFADSVAELLSEPAEGTLMEAVEFILANPPQIQIINEDGSLIWSRNPSFDGSSAPRKTLGHVRQVRNNLFHGGKFNGRWIDPSRSEPLLQHSITILEACLNASDEVGQAYRTG